jgi:osomolarity two-component system sensor histidine kinase SLN1
MEVLVVDDDPLTRTLMKRMLSRMGCHVSTAENGELALEMILGATHTSNPHDSTGTADPLSGSAAPVPPEDKYAVVFLDNQMPVMSGLKTVEKLRDLGRQDFVVGVTGEYRLS